MYLPLLLLLLLLLLVLLLLLLLVLLLLSLLSLLLWLSFFVIAVITIAIFYLCYHWNNNYCYSCHHADIISYQNSKFLVCFCWFTFVLPPQKKFFWGTTMEIKPHSFFVLSLPSDLVRFFFVFFYFYFTLQFSFWL